MKGKVMQIYILDEKGYWIREILFINIEKSIPETIKNLLPKLKKCKNTSTAIKEVVYNVY